jgi:DNA-binding NarL/FixJ family response regulator
MATLVLSSDDLALLRLLSEGHELPAIARATGRSTPDVELRLLDICRSLDVAAPIAAVVRAVQLGLI